MIADRINPVEEIISVTTEIANAYAEMVSKTEEMKSAITKVISATTGMKSATAEMKIGDAKLISAVTEIVSGNAKTQTGAPEKGISQMKKRLRSSAGKSPNIARNPDVCDATVDHKSDGRWRPKEKTLTL